MSLPAPLLDRIAALTGPRHLIALAGPPAGGKSTLAAALADHLNAETPSQAAILGQDGFHFDDAILGPRGDLPRKGAPHTFDVAGLDAMLTRIADPNAQDVAVPVFDRSLEASRNAADLIPAATRIVIVEGNYLLLQAPPWSELRRHFDLTVLISPPIDTLRARLMERWADLGPEIARRKTEENDLPNATLVLSKSAPADLSLP